AGSRPRCGNHQDGGSRCGDGGPEKGPPGFPLGDSGDFPTLSGRPVVAIWVVHGLLEYQRVCLPPLRSRSVLTQSGPHSAALVRLTVASGVLRRTTVSRPTRSRNLV